MLYLWVSTPSQVKTDYNPKGISLPAQRDACRVEAASSGASGAGAAATRWTALGSVESVAYSQRDGNRLAGCSWKAATMP